MIVYLVILLALISYIVYFTVVCGPKIAAMDSNTRGLFQKVDSIEYWKVRGRDAMKGVQ